MLLAARAVALFFGGFCLVNLIGGLRVRNFDANLWWVDLRALPGFIATGLLWVAAPTLLAFGLLPPVSAWRRTATTGVALVLGMASQWNVFEYYSVLIHGRAHTWFPVPFSAVVLAAFALIFRVNAHGKTNGQTSRLSAPLLVALAACVVLFPIAQMFSFGKTDYRRAADIAVVLGARTYKDGRPSDALQDRVRTACQLYRQGLVKKIIISGGPGDGAITEAEAGRRLCLQLGIAGTDLIMDDLGLNTAATIRNVRAISASLGAGRILVVSHFYHLPRVKLSFQRAGIDVFTVPADERHMFWKMPYFIARETAAAWSYYLRPLAG